MSEAIESNTQNIQQTWSTPTFTKSFEPCRFQQTTDAHFRAVVTGKPVPEVSWSRKGKVLPCSEKYEYQYDPQSGQITLQIRDLGPGDEGQYSCTASNDYGSVTAHLNLNPDINNVKYRVLSNGTCRHSLQRKMIKEKGQMKAEDQNGMTL